MLISNELIWLKKTLTLRLFFTWFNALVNTPSEVQQSKLISTQNSLFILLKEYCNFLQYGNFLQMSSPHWILKDPIKPSKKSLPNENL